MCIACAAQILLPHIATIRGYILVKWCEYTQHVHVSFFNASVSWYSLSQGEIMSGQLKRGDLLKCFTNFTLIVQYIPTLMLHPEMKPLLNCVGSKF